LLPQRKADYNVIGLPPHTGLFEYLASTAPFLAMKISSLQSQTERDNNFVHFQLVPAVTALPSLPVIAAIMQPSVLSLPEVETVNFIMPIKTGFFSGLFGGSRTSQSADLATSTSIVAKSDPGKLLSLKWLIIVTYLL
jgi:hypothetical protein